MTPNDQNSNNSVAANADRIVDAAVDKILDHNCQQLSALLDGELPPEEARFLLRRLQHDAELGDCWERWQLCGDVLRGQVDALLPPGFAGRVTAAIAIEPGVSITGAASGPRWLRWGGSAALAASVAVIALFLARQAPDAKGPAAGISAQVAAAMPAPATPQTESRTRVPSPNIPDHAAPPLATAVAVADVPRRVASRRSRGQSQRAALRTPARAAVELPFAMAVNASAVANAATPVDPFSAQRVSLPNRPWPRALLPGSTANGAFTVDYGNRSALSPSFYPFEPRTLPAPPAAEAVPDHGDAPP